VNTSIKMKEGSREYFSSPDLLPELFLALLCASIINNDSSDGGLSSDNTSCDISEDDQRVQKVLQVQRAEAKRGFYTIPMEERKKARMS